MADYYAILGVEKTANAEDIKSAYRKLAKEFHPDINKAPGAEEKFKEISEAYEVLSDPRKRFEHDNHNDMLSQFRMHRQVHKEPNSSVQIAIAIDPFDAMAQFTKNISYDKVVFCSDCNGEGGRSDGNAPSVCPECNGLGRIVRIIAEGFFNMQQDFGPCRRCKSRGFLHKIVCQTCSGFGAKKETVTQQINFPVGCLNKQFILHGMGSQEDPRQQPGPLIIQCKLQDNPYFKIDEAENCYYFLDLDPVEAIVGTEKKVMSLERQEISIKIPKFSKSGQKLQFKNKGFHRNSNGRGDFIIELRHKMPDKLTEEQEKILKSYLSSLS